MILAGWTYRNATWQEEAFPPPEQPSAGQQCLGQGGNAAYCRCLDRLATARSAAGLAEPPWHEFDDPLVREALKRPDLFPIVNADTKRCIFNPGPAPRRAPFPAPAPAPASGGGDSRA